MSKPAQSEQLTNYINSNREDLTEYLIHGDNSFVRGLILNAFREAGTPEDFDRLRQMIDKAEKEHQN